MDDTIATETRTYTFVADVYGRRVTITVEGQDRTHALQRLTRLNIGKHTWTLQDEAVS